MKKCSKRTCYRRHDTKYKQCETCRENDIGYKKKRKRAAAQLDVCGKKYQNVP